MNKRQNEEEIKRQSFVNASILGLSNSILSTNSIDDVSFLILEYARILTNSPFGYTGYLQKDSDFLIVAALTKNIWAHCKVNEKAIKYKNCNGLPAQIIKQAKPVILNIDDNEKNELSVPEGHIEINSFLSMPCMIGNNVIGQIALANAKDGYNNDDLNIIEQISYIYAFAIERYQHEQEMAKKQAQLIHASRLTILGEMATAIAHELGQPLQIIKMAGEVISQNVEQNEITPHNSNKQNEVYEYLNIINDQVNRASKIIENIRYFSIQQNNTILSNINIKEHFLKAIGFFKEQFRAHNINFEIEIIKDECYGVIHPQKFQQIIVNLLTNACFAVEMKNKDENLKDDKNIFARLLKKKNNLIIEVEDNGIGMDDNVKKNCINPFFTTKPSNKASGLGLTIISNIIKEMSGKMKIITKPNEGSLFRIYIPV